MRCLVVIKMGATKTYRYATGPERDIITDFRCTVCTFLYSFHLSLLFCLYITVQKMKYVFLLWSEWKVWVSEWEWARKFNCKMRGRVKGGKESWWETTNSSQVYVQCSHEQLNNKLSYVEISLAAIFSLACGDFSHACNLVWWRIVLLQVMVMPHLFVSLQYTLCSLNTFFSRLFSKLIHLICGYYVH